MTSKRKQIEVLSDETDAVKVESSPTKRQYKRTASSKTSTASDGAPAVVETPKRKRDVPKRQTKQNPTATTATTTDTPKRVATIATEKEQTPPPPPSPTVASRKSSSDHHYQPTFPVPVPVETAAAPKDEPHADPPSLPGDTAIPPHYFSTPTLLSNRYIPQRLLGTGTYSAAYLALDQHSSTGRHVSAPKYVAIKRMASKEYNALGMSEFKILQFLHSHSPPPTHIVTPLNRFFDPTGTLHIVLEPLNSATPITIPPCSCPTRHTHYACPIRIKTLRKLSLNLNLALLELHKHGIIHADLKPANILYTNPPTEDLSIPPSTSLKLIDLGNVIPPERRQLYTSDYNLCSASYRPPEILLGSGPISRKIDIWSAGLILLEWYLGPDGIQELADWLVSRALPGEGDVVRNRFTEGCGLMELREGNHDELVDHLVLLFGSVGCYREGMYYESWYDEICYERVLDPVSNRSVIVERSGAVWPFLEEKMRGSSEGAGTVRFLQGLLDVDVDRRWGVQEVLKDSWLVSGLLGEWAQLLMAADGRGPVMRAETETEPAQARAELRQSARASLRPETEPQRPDSKDGEEEGLPTLKSSGQESPIEVEGVAEAPKKASTNLGSMVTSDDGLARLELL
ncbi:kinase-like protein [Ascobolus immersus RN42]|uniref:Kinase-like protein n=1 Tax=Ascobolus immersus RN42 TaxID=1160509 RepID=A0A3N4IGE7_ASCIM|nr:kinase-like protein [Ascobolus immersus RN42]